MESNYQDALEQMREDEKNEEFANKMAEDIAKDEYEAEQAQYEIAKKEAELEYKFEQAQNELDTKDAAASGLEFTNAEDTALDVTGCNDDDALNVDCHDNSTCLNNEQ